MPFSDDSSIIEALASYKKLVEDEDNHLAVLKDKTTILFAASLLDHRNPQVIKASLEVLEPLIRNVKTHSIILMTFGIFESLETASVGLREKNPQLAEKAKQMVDALAGSAPPAYNTRNRLKKITNKSNSRVYILHVNELEKKQNTLQSTLVKTPGIISFVIDPKNNRCTVRIIQKITLLDLLTRIKQGELEPKVIKRNRNNEETLIDILNGESEDTFYSEASYLPEDDSLMKPVRLFSSVKTKSSSFFQTATELWNKSFHW